MSRGIPLLADAASMLGGCWDVTLNETDSQAVEQFVRNTLGCRCPDEVFRSIAVRTDTLPGGEPPFRRLVIGDRLLVYVLALRPGPASADAVEALAALGRADRDDRGYNRFRLVLAASTDERVPGAIIDGFAKVVAGDARAHLHLVSNRELPRVIEPT